MTFSVVARCARTGQVGVGALTAIMGVGKLASYAEAGVGAIASQGTVNPYLGIDGLALLAEGRSAEDVLEEIVRADPGRDVRQCGIVDVQGRTASWTGSQTPGWSGHLGAAGVMAQGNRLVGRETLEAAVEAFHAHPGKELAERLLLAVEAGESTGADRNGARSGTVLVMDTEAYPLWDARIDSSDHPAAALRTLMDEMAVELLPEIRKLPTRQDPMGEAARSALSGA